MIENVLIYTLNLSLAIHIALIAVCVWRVGRGENLIDRLIGLDMTATLILAVLVLVSFISQDVIYIDIALALAALGFIGTIALARYIADQEMF
jgi:multisubunit Na+/H+ antiporter MnhF subunit